MPEIITRAARKESLEWLIDLMATCPTEIVRMAVSDWAEQNRTLAEGLTPYPGSYSFDVNPYMKEIVNCMSESETVRECAVMKGTQIMFTVGCIENWIGYTIDVAPGPMLYVTGDAGLADTQMELRVDSMINNSGLAHKIGAQERREGQRKTGDIKARKEFPGGFLVAAGPRSGAKLRSMSFQKINVDEVDAFPDSTGQEGDPIYLIRRRTDAYSEMYKILWGSTPLFAHNSKIKKLYDEGDQRKYYVPCKHCGHMQFLRWGRRGTKGGLHFDHDIDDRLIAKYNKNGEITESTVRYECEKCGGEWTNADKDYFLPLGEWRPTAQPRRPGMRSYHIPGLLSPVGFRSWESGVIEYLNIKHAGFPKNEFQNWINTFLGEPFEDAGEKPKIETLLTQERTYHRGQLPDDAKPFFVTIGADVQKDRIECEIVAWGWHKESWSIDYIVIPGDTSDIEDQCWEAFRSIISSKYAGMQPVLTGVDAGYRSDIVYEFCDKFPGGVHPVMGSDQVRKSRDYIKLFEVQSHRVPRVDINTDLLKQEIYRYLAKGQYESGQYPRGYCHFPSEYERKYFNMLTAEERILIKNKFGQKAYKWDAGERRNEALDCRVYSLAMVYAYRLYIETTLRDNGDIDDDTPFEWRDFWEYFDK